MRYRLRDLPHLARTPLGRMELWNGVRYRCWPIVSRMAGWHRARNLRGTRVVSVVGSYGKTTTARALIAALGCRAYQRTGLNCWNHVAEALLRVSSADSYAVLEIGIDGPGQMEMYARMVRPDVTVVTSIGSEHHRSLGSLSATREEKSRMVRILGERGTAVLNGDDENVLWMRDHTPARVLTFGFAETNDVFATDVVETNDSTTFRLHSDASSHSMEVRLVGRHTISAVLAAVAVVEAEGLPFADAGAALEQMEPTPGRMQPVALANGVTLLRDDYKSSLETVHAALDTFSRMSARRKIAVFGEVSEPPGSQGPVYRRIGQRLATIADTAIFVGGNFQRYAAGAVAGGMPRSAMVDGGGSVLEATRHLLDHMREGDLVLIKGRDTQRLERIACGLEGRQVRCDIGFCPTRLTSCSECPMLARGWHGRRVVI
jgi:UDP-N-acetylmuramoyl-tripeptide--D-alanyl-D-alanine ligase